MVNWLSLSLPLSTLLAFQRLAETEARSIRLLGAFVVGVRRGWAGCRRGMRARGHGWCEFVSAQCGGLAVLAAGGAWARVGRLFADPGVGRRCFVCACAAACVVLVCCRWMGCLVARGVDRGWRGCRSTHRRCVAVVGVRGLSE